MKIFFAYRTDSTEPPHFSQKTFATQVRYYLMEQSPLKEVYLYEDEPQPGPYPQQLGTQIRDCDAFVLFADRRPMGKTQKEEATRASERWEALRPGSPRRPKLLLVNCAALDADDAALDADDAALDADGAVSKSKSPEPEPKSPEPDAWVQTFNDPASITSVSAYKLLRQDPSLLGSAGATAGLAQEVARLICFHLGFAAEWMPYYQIPRGYPFAYEKSIIEAYIDGKGRLDPKWLNQGCPETWPLAENVAGKKVRRNSVPESLIGKYSSSDESVAVDVRVHLLADAITRMQEERGFLTFAEARPREWLAFPKDDASAAPGKGLSVGILVSGGIAPGINSVISGIVDRHHLYQHPPTESSPLYHLEVYGFANGFQSLVQTPVNRIPLNEGDWRRQVEEGANRGGSLLGTSRMDTLLNSDPRLMQQEFGTMVRNLRAQGIDILYVIGGDGSMRAAHALQVAARKEDYDLSVVGIPKTMDNDILWVWQSFGFLSAVEKAKEFIEQLHTEARSNPRLCVMQLFGSDSGFVVSHAALASGAVDLALIPEVPFSMEEVSKYVCGKLEQQFHKPQSPYGLVLMAETAIPTDVERLIEADEQREPHERILRLDEEEKHQIAVYLQNGRRVRGQTPDALRTGGLKIVARVLQDEIKKRQGSYWKGYRVFTNEPRHLLRSLDPSASDIIFGHRLGCLAVDNALAGYTDFMVSQWLTEFVLVPLRLVVLGRKRVPTGGIFWRSVLDATGQPADLDLK